MASRQEEIIVKLGADTKTLQRELGMTRQGVAAFARDVAGQLQSGSFPEGWKQAAQRVKNYREEISKLSKESQAVIAGQKPVAAPAGGDLLAGLKQMIVGGAIVTGIKKVLDHFDDLNDQASNLSISTDFLQGMEHIASKDIVGGVQTFNKGITELSIKLGDAKNGGDKAIETFQKWGISISDIQTMDTEGMFYLIADRIKAIPDPALRTSAAFELMGKAGKNMAGELALGGIELQKIVNATTKISEVDVKMLAEAKDMLSDLTNTITMFFGVQLATVGNSIKKIDDLITRYAFLGKIAKALGSLVEYSPVGLAGKGVAKIGELVEPTPDPKKLAEVARQSAAAKGAANQTAAKSAANTAQKQASDYLTKQQELAALKSANAAKDRDEAKFKLGLNKLANEELRLRVKIASGNLTGTELLEKQLALEKVKGEQIDLIAGKQAKANAAAAAAASKLEKIQERINYLKQQIANNPGGVPTGPDGKPAAGNEEFMPTLADLAEAGIFTRDAARLQFLQRDAMDAARWGNKKWLDADLQEISDIRGRLIKFGVMRDPNKSMVDELKKLTDPVEKNGGLPVTFKLDN